MKEQRERGERRVGKGREKSKRNQIEREREATRSKRRGRRQQHSYHHYPEKATTTEFSFVPQLWPRPFIPTTVSTQELKYPDGLNGGSVSSEDRIRVEVCNTKLTRNQEPLVPITSGFLSLLSRRQLIL